MCTLKSLKKTVIPAQAGIQAPLHVDSRLRGNDAGFMSSSIIVLDSTDFEVNIPSTRFTYRGGNFFDPVV